MDYGDDKETRFVIVSAAVALFQGPETYIFPAAGPDAVTPSDWGELRGSFRGALDHAEALRGAGYDVE